MTIGKSTNHSAPTEDQAIETPRKDSSPTVPAVPARIADKILRLKGLETRLGHLPPDEISIKELHERISDPQFETHANQLEQQTELLFGDICDELLESGFTPSQIADAVNVQLLYKGGPKYCNEAEVRECLGMGNTPRS
jgi:hypothetical protein